jgi:DNA repair exonuclease SbcCD ATPase subunit
MSTLKSQSGHKFSISENDGTYVFQLPFAYKDLFRTIFKSAKWNAVEKAFETKANTANRNKWQKFLEAANGLSQEMDAAADAEATVEELQSLLSKSESMRNELQQKIRDCKSKVASLSSQIEQCQLLVQELGPIAESAAAAVADILEEAKESEERHRSAAAPAMSIFDSNDVEGIFAKMMRAGQRGYLGKPDLEGAQEELIKVSKQLRSAGYRHSLIERICNHSLNRPDKFCTDVSHARATLLTGLKRIEHS